MTYEAEIRIQHDDPKVVVDDFQVVTALLEQEPSVTSALPSMLVQPKNLAVAQRARAAENRPKRGAQYAVDAMRVALCSTIRTLRR